MKKKFYIHETDNGYIYDKRLFWGMLAIILVLVFFVAKDYNYNFTTQFYFKCRQETCINPLVDKELNYQAYNQFTGYDYKKDCKADWCTQEFLPRGEYGVKPPNSFIFKYFFLISFFLFCIAITSNHLIHNKGKKFGIKINLPDKWLDKIRKWGNKFGELEE